MAEKARAQEALFALREQIARLEGKALPALAAAKQEERANQQEAEHVSHGKPLLSFNIPALDKALDGGLPLDSIIEIRTIATHDAGAASGFALSLVSQLASTDASSLPVLWIAEGFSVREVGIPCASGLRQFGVDPYNVYHASLSKLSEALWLAEAALASGVFGATLLEVHGNPKTFGLTESRRLNLRAKAAGRPLFLLRHAGGEEASSASFRLLVEPAPALERRLPDGTMLGGSIGHPVFQLTLEKSRNPAPLSFLLEWNPRDRQFHLARTPKGSAFGSSWPARSGALLSASANRQDRPEALGPVLAFERAS